MRRYQRALESGEARLPSAWEENGSIVIRIPDQQWEQQREEWRTKRTGRDGDDGDRIRKTVRMESSGQRSAVIRGAVRNFVEPLSVPSSLVKYEYLSRGVVDQIRNAIQERFTRAMDARRLMIAHGGLPFDEEYIRTALLESRIQDETVAAQGRHKTRVALIDLWLWWKAIRWALGVDCYITGRTLVWESDWGFTGDSDDDVDLMDQLIGMRNVYRRDFLHLTERVIDDVRFIVRGLVEHNKERNILESWGRVPIGVTRYYNEIGVMPAWKQMTMPELAALVDGWYSVTVSAECVDLEDVYEAIGDGLLTNVVGSAWFSLVSDGDAGIIAAVPSLIHARPGVEEQFVSRMLEWADGSIDSVVKPSEVMQILEERQWAVWDE